jgi:hypothetical protein
MAVSFVFSITVPILSASMSSVSYFLNIFKTSRCFLESNECYVYFLLLLILLEIIAVNAEIFLLTGFYQFEVGK